MADNDPAKPVRAIRDVKLLWLSLVLWPGPYQSIPKVTTKGDR